VLTNLSDIVLASDSLNIPKSCNKRCNNRHDKFILYHSKYKGHIQNFLMTIRPSILTLNCIWGQALQDIDRIEKRARYSTAMYNFKLQKA